MTEHSQSYPVTPGAFHPDNNLPDCMMPDGGECCAGHVALVEDWRRQRDELERLRERCEAYKGQVKAGAAEIARLNGVAQPLWQVEEYTFWKGLGYTTWHSINIVSRNYMEMIETIEYLQNNNPDRVFRIWPDSLPLPSTNHQSLDQLLDGMTDENRHEELPTSPISSTEGK